MKKFISVLSMIFLFSCSTQQVSKELSLNSVNKILSIEEYDYAYYIKAFNQDTKKQLNIISYKQVYFDKYKIQKPINNSQDGLKTISKNNSYNFNLTEMRFNVSNMEQLGAYVIIENDTIWKGKPTVENRFYESKNSLGLIIRQ